MPRKSRLCAPVVQNTHADQAGQGLLQRVEILTQKARRDLVPFLVLISIKAIEQVHDQGFLQGESNFMPRRRGKLERDHASVSELQHRFRDGVPEADGPEFLDAVASASEIR